MANWRGLSGDIGIRLRRCRRGIRGGWGSRRGSWRGLLGVLGEERKGGCGCRFWREERGGEGWVGARWRVCWIFICIGGMELELEEVVVVVLRVVVREGKSVFLDVTRIPYLPIQHQNRPLRG